MGGHEGEDNVLRDDDLALFLTQRLGIRGGADDPEPSAAVVAQAKIGRESSLRELQKCQKYSASEKVNGLLR